MGVKFNENKLFVFFLFVYVVSGFSLSRFDSGLAAANLFYDFYSALGFDLDLVIARLLVVFLFCSICCHIGMILLIKRGESDAVIGNSNGREIIYLFARAIFAFLFCAVAVGALGDVISSRRTSLNSKEISVAIGSFVFGGATWLIRDFFVSVLSRFIRK